MPKLSHTYGPDSTDRVGTHAEDPKDRDIIEKVKHFGFKCFEDEIVVKMPYVDSVNSTYAVPNGTNGFYQYKINSIYDPDLTGVGGQPLSRDTWAGIYNYYKVLEAKIRVEIIDTTHETTAGKISASTAAPTIYGGMLDITATPPANRQAWLNAYAANNANRQQLFSYPQTYNVIGSRGDSRLHFEMNWKPELFEKNVIQGGGDPGWTAVGSDPVLLEYLTLIAHNPEAVSRYCWFRVEIDYIVAFKQVNKTLLNTNN